MKKPKADQHTSAATRRAYDPPRVEDLGTVASLTKTKTKSAIRTTRLNATDVVKT